MEAKTIKLPCFGIVVELNDQDCGTIQSDLQEVCPACNDRSCDGFCPAWDEYISDRDSIFQLQKSDERKEFIKFRFGIHAIESLILGHAVAGVDITNLAYIQGIETAVDALWNNI
jgi:hypothetical protein